MVFILLYLDVNFQASGKVYRLWNCAGGRDRERNRRESGMRGLNREGERRGLQGENMRRDYLNSKGHLRDHTETYYSRTS